VRHGKNSHLNGGLNHDKRLGAVGEGLVDEGEEAAEEKTQEPHTEGPYWLGRVVGVGYCETNFLNGRHLVFVHFACVWVLCVEPHAVLCCAVRDKNGKLLFQTSNSKGK